MTSFYLSPKLEAAYQLSTERFDSNLQIIALEQNIFDLQLKQNLIDSEIETEICLNKELKNDVQRKSQRLILQNSEIYISIITKIKQKELEVMKLKAKKSFLADQIRILTTVESEE